MCNPFDAMFDFNGDGRLDSMERAIQMEFIEHELESTADTDDLWDTEMDGDDYDEF